MEQQTWFAAWVERIEYIWPEFWTATVETVYMVAMSTVLSLALGFILAVYMILTHPQGIRPRPRVYHVLDVAVNLIRSFPFLILLIALLPFTRLVLGTTIGSSAAVIPLTIAAAPFAGRIIEGCFLEVDKGVVEAARSFGASDMQIIWRVLVPEALPAIVLNIAVLAITLLGYSAMAGTVGGGGLGDLAVKYGYYRFQGDVMFYSVVVLLVMVQAMQSLSSFVYKRLR
ncbi:MAG: ABC transporter permease [Planctomycetaceae bacterium]|nr:ABC transporter permease [Planctomycetaceae bacterium]